MTTLVQFLRCAHPLIGTIVDMRTISNAMGLILVRRPSMRKKPCFHTGTGGTGGRFIAPAVVPIDASGSSATTPAACGQTMPTTVSSCVPSGFSLLVELPLGLIDTSHGVKTLPPYSGYHAGRYRNDHGRKHVSAREREVFFGLMGSAVS